MSGEINIPDVEMLEHYHQVVNAFRKNSYANHMKNQTGTPDHLTETLLLVLRNKA